ncbi:MAG: RHS repeat-associated core domain-containing protein, partial [Bacteroidota bacterium]
TKTTDYVGEFIYENNELQLIQHEEGRIVPDPATGNYDYEYYLKDHLGNTRVTFTTKPKTIDFTLNYEGNSADPDDEALFDNLQNVITADVHDRVDAGNESFNHTNVQALNGATNGVIGSVLTIPVGAGDKVSAEVYAKYLAPTSTNNPAAAVGNLVIAAITGSTGTNNYEGAINSGYGSSGTVTNLINANSSGTEPMAFINLLFLPDDVTGSITTDHFAFKQVTSASSNNQAILALDQPYEAPEAGYVVVYLSNESAQLTEVYFDDLKVTVEEHPVIETSDYYPFGLTHAGGFKRVTAKENRFKFSGKERIDDLDLGWDDFGARMYMSDIGRWGVMDNFADIYLNLSPYNYVANNPIILTDPDGNTIVDSEGNVVGIEFDDDGNITNITGTEDQSLMDLIRNTYADSDVGRESITTLNAEGTTYQINISEEGAIWESPDGGFGSVDGFSGPGQEFDVEINIFGNSTENTSDVSEENFDSFTVYDPYGDTQKVGKKKKQKIIDSVNSGEAAAQHGAHQQSLGNLTPDQLAKYNAARQADKNNPSLRSTNTLIYETANSTNRWDVKGETAGKIAVGTAHTQRKKQ